MSTTVNPTDEELTIALRTLRTENESLGTTKLHALLLSTHAGWSVSEKRVKKILTSAGLLVAPPQPKHSNSHANGKNGAESADPDRKIFPKSSLVDNLDVGQWTPSVKVVQFGPGKGKGLVAREKIEEGKHIWKEEPWVVAPEWDIYELQKNARACAHCTTPLTSTSSLIVACPHPSSPSHPNNVCTARFCNRLCLTRAQATIHPLMCPGKNPGIVPLLEMAAKKRWMALHAVALCVARILLWNERSGEANSPGAKPKGSGVKNEWQFFQSLAEITLDERALATGAQPDHKLWKEAHKLLVQAFSKPESAAGQKALAKTLKAPLPEEMHKGLFEYEAFLRMVGRMSLNMEAHGGIYILHSHINHSCTPNVSARHLDTRTALSRLTLIARSDIRPGEELTVSYVDPALPLVPRRKELEAWGFGICRCSRCTKEEAEERDKAATKGANGEEPEAKVVDPDLERELKESFGVA